MKKICALVLSVTLLTGCSSLLPKGAPAPRIYTLNALSPVSKPVPAPLPFSVKILKPQAAPGLDTERIALRKDNNQFDYFADAKWAGDPATLVQASLVEGFEASRRVRSVSNDLVVLNSDYNLLIELRDFQTDYKTGATTAAHVRMTAKLINTQTEEIVQTYQYDRSEAVNGSGLDAIVLAFDKAQQGIAQMLVNDVLNSLVTVPVKTDGKSDSLKP